MTMIVTNPWSDNWDNERIKGQLSDIVTMKVTKSDDCDIVRNPRLWSINYKLDLTCDIISYRY